MKAFPARPGYTIWDEHEIPTFARTLQYDIEYVIRINPYFRRVEGNVEHSSRLVHKGMSDIPHNWEFCPL